MRVHMSQASNHDVSPCAPPNPVMTTSLHTHHQQQNSDDTYVHKYVHLTHPMQMASELICRGPDHGYTAGLAQDRMMPSGTHPVYRNAGQDANMNVNCGRAVHKVPFFNDIPKQTNGLREEFVKEGEKVIGEFVDIMPNIAEVQQHAKAIGKLTVKKIGVQLREDLKGFDEIISDKRAGYAEEMQASVRTELGRHLHDAKYHAQIAKVMPTPSLMKNESPSDRLPMDMLWRVQLFQASPLVA